MPPVCLHSVLNRGGAAVRFYAPWKCLIFVDGQCVCVCAVCRRHVVMDLMVDLHTLLLPCWLWILNDVLCARPRTLCCVTRVFLTLRFLRWIL